MPKPTSGKGRAAPPAPSGPPVLYSEALSGAPLVVLITAPVPWTATRSTEAGGKDESLTCGARWGHAALLSPRESVLCVVGGTSCITPTTSDVSAPSPLPLWECTSAATATAPAATASSTAAGKSSAATAGTPTARAWRAGGPPRTAHAHDIGRVSPLATAPHAWPLFASWWATWPAGSGTDAPTVLYADGGWSGARRLAGVRAFADGAGAGVNLPPPPHTARSHHSVVSVLGRLLRFGGETQQGTAAALEEIDGGAALVDERRRTDVEVRDGEEAAEAVAALSATIVASPAEPASTPPTTAPPLSQPPPPRAAHGACSLSQRYMLLVGGRHVQTQTDGGDAAAGAGAAGKGAKVKKSTPGKRGGTPGREAKGGGGGAVESAELAAASLTALKDVAVYDAKLGLWLPVRVVGGGAVPCPRYAAAVAAVPAPGTAAPAGRHRGPVADVVQREVLLVGGLDAAGAVCADAWVLQVLSGADAELAEVPADGAGAGPAAATPAAAVVPVVKVRWVRLELPSASAAAAAVPVFQRHHAAVVVSSQRVVYLVGGCTAHGAAEPSVCTFVLPPLTTTSVRPADEFSGDADDAAQARAAASAKGRPAAK
ncbi:hypothetical protein NESM_000684800 [Novymonas esmeraldas]|uniref:Uncharacterized protein n=1 Tax=Novymonas esmeraldas TaxID=1808958 RepID=A0AAW0ET30_9TRYP